VGHTIPAVLTDNVENEIRQIVPKALMVAGVTSSVSHTEVIVDYAENVYVLEIASRPGAGRISDLVKLATSRSIPSLVVHAAFAREQTHVDATPSAAASRMIVAPRTGWVRQIKNLPAVQGDVVDVYVNRPPGAQIVSSRDNRSRVAQIVIRGRSASEVNDISRMLAEEVEVDVQDDEPDGI
jgi:biotin carboxylase